MLILPHPDMGKRLHDCEDATPQWPWSPVRALLIVVALGFVFDRLASEARSPTDIIGAGQTADATEGE
ncbi:MAG TPA: hypothetical protein VIU14_03830 [Mesorhizobium sp.]|jgi:hypothetical protein